MPTRVPKMQAAFRGFVAVIPSETQKRVQAAPANTLGCVACNSTLTSKEDHRHQLRAVAHGGRRSSERTTIKRRCPTYAKNPPCQTGTTCTGHTRHLVSGRPRNGDSVCNQPSKAPLPGTWRSLCLRLDWYKPNC
jgi:hypothetical protein